MLEVKNIARSFREKKVLCDISFICLPGEIVSIEGPSGIGKSTVARILCGTILPEKGDVLLDGESVYDRKGIYRREIHKKIQLVPQQPYASLDPVMKVIDQVAEPILYHSDVRDRKKALEEAGSLLSSLGLGKELWGRKPSELSGGQAQRVLIARALSVSPEYLISDESTSMLDPPGQKQVAEIYRDLASKGIGILMISHDHGLLRMLSDRIYYMENGMLVKTYPEIKENEV